MTEQNERKFTIGLPPTKLFEQETQVSQEDLEYLKLCLDAYTAAPLQDGMLQYYNSQASQSDTMVERRIDTEGYDFRDKLGLPRK